MSARRASDQGTIHQEIYHYLIWVYTYSSTHGMKPRAGPART
jgi:hypothetical protein